MSPLRIVVSLWGGSVRGVFCSEPTAELTLVNFNLDGSRPDHPNRVQFRGEHGACATIVEFPHCESLGALQDTDEALAIAAAKRMQSRRRARHPEPSASKTRFRRAP